MAENSLLMIHAPLRIPMRGYEAGYSIREQARHLVTNPHEGL